jgi:hypothetical protein
MQIFRRSNLKHFFMTLDQAAIVQIQVSIILLLQIVC